jgi:hypothetical protein
MAAYLTRFVLVSAACLALGACAASDPRTSARLTQTTPAEAARALGCNDDEVAVCMDSNCELEEYYCAPREDVRKMFKAGEFRD